MGKFFAFSMVCAVLTVTSTSAAYYNQAKVDLYTRLSQQLRYQMADQVSTTLARVSALTTGQHNARSALDNGMQAVHDYLHIFDAAIFTTFQQARKYPMTALQLRVSDYYPWTLHNIFWNTIEWSHGIYYDTGTGDSIIQKTGVYLMEYCVLETPLTYIKVRIRVVTPSGTYRYDFVHHLKYSASPVLQTLELYKGDRFDTVTMQESGNYMWVASGNVPVTVVGGISNQLNFRYLGEIP